MHREFLLCSVFALAACAESVAEQPGEVVFEGEFIEFRVADRAPAYCEGVPEYLDRYAGALFDELGVEPGPGLVSYALVHPDDVMLHGESYNAFSSESGIVSGTPVLEHEVGHAVQREEYGRQFLLTEGLAEFFGGDASTPDRVSTDASARELVEHVAEERGIRGHAYGDAGRFVAHLDKEFGRDVLLRLLELTSRDDVSVEAFSSKVEAVTGLPWAQVASDYDASPLCDQAEYWDATAACFAARPIALCNASEEVWHEVDLGCGSKEVLGEREDFSGISGPEIWTYRTVTFEQAGRYGMLILAQWDEPSVGYIELKQCSGGCGSFLQRFEVPTGPSVAEPFDIEEPGEYLLKIARPVEAPSEAEFSIVGGCG